MLNRPFFQYLVALCTDWISLMSGVFSLLFLVIGFTQKPTSNWQIKYWFVAAVGGQAIASYRVWYKTRPDVKIDVLRLCLDSGLGWFEQLNSPQTFLTLELLIVNTRPGDNAIKTCECTIEINDRKYLGQLFAVRGLVLKHSGTEIQGLNLTEFPILKQGNPTKGWIRFMFDGVPIGQVWGKDFVLIMSDTNTDTSRRIKGRITLDEDADELALKDRTPPEAFKC